MGMEIRPQGCKRKSALRWNGTDSDLIELVAALMAAGSVDCAEGKKLTIVDVIRVFEDAFNIKINALYTKRGKVFDRCTDSTPFIDSLRKSYIRTVSYTHLTLPTNSMSCCGLTTGMFSLQSKTSVNKSSYGTIE